jgi:hypothetical protein
MILRSLLLVSVSVLLISCAAKDCGCASPGTEAAGTLVASALPGIPAVPTSKKAAQNALLAAAKKASGADAVLTTTQAVAAGDLQGAAVGVVSATPQGQAASMALDAAKKADGLIKKK